MLTTAYIIGGIVLFIFGIWIAYETFTSWPGWLGFFLMILTFYGCNVSPAVQKEQEEYSRIEEERDKLCETPFMEAEVDGVKLYSVRPNGCRSTLVYFSKGGTHTSHEECSGAKTRSCHTVVDETSNSQ